MITTPLGNIEIYIDGKLIDYQEQNIGASKSICPDITGRFCIEIDYEPDRKQHVISCKIKGYTISNKDEIESGEKLELKSFYKKNIKLSIGMEGEAGYYSDGGKESAIYDYDNEYLAYRRYFLKLWTMSEISAKIAYAKLWHGKMIIISHC